MADDWQVGDLALCVRGGFKMRRGGPAAPESMQIAVGSVHTVSGVFEARDQAYRAEGVRFLTFQDCIGRQQYDCRGFRKIKPLTDEERRSFVAELDCPVLQPNQEVAQTVRADGRP